MHKDSWTNQTLIKWNVELAYGSLTMMADTAIEALSRLTPVELKNVESITRVSPWPPHKEG